MNPWIWTVFQLMTQTIVMAEDKKVAKNSDQVPSVV